MKIYEVELWNTFFFAKAKGYHKVLIFGPKYTYLGIHVKDNSNKKVKVIVIIHVFNKFDMLFWCFWQGYVLMLYVRTDTKKPQL